MATEHTHAPGPWVLCYDGQIDSADGNLVVSLPFDSYREFKESPDVVKANYRLMTAAPVLFEYFNASTGWINTVGHEEATVEDENKAEARYDAAIKAVHDALARNAA